MDNSVVLSEYQAFPEVTAISINNGKQLPVVTEIFTTICWCGNDSNLLSNLLLPFHQGGKYPSTMRV